VQPYLTFVVSARNDNYGGNFLRRMQVFVNVLGEWTEREGLDAELIVAEWNPPKDAAGIREAIMWPKGLLARVRIVEVSPEIHRSLPNSHRMPMFEYIAKNVGIRRAAGEYVVATNPDIVFEKKLIAYLATRQLHSDCFYRVDRYDVREPVPLSISADKQIRFCARHAYRVFRMHGTVSTSSLVNFKRYLRRNLPRLSPKPLVRGLAWHAIKLIRSPTAASVPAQRALPSVHTNASGDFMLMSRERWHALRAYPELGTFSHIDSYFMYIAATAGLRQTVLRFPIFHQEHDRSDRATRPLTVLEEIPAFRQMRETSQPVITNDENWGLGNAELPTAVVG
jgi:hypothetical protein